MKRIKSRLFVMWYDVLRWRYRRAQNKQTKALAQLLAFEAAAIEAIQSLPGFKKED